MIRWLKRKEFISSIRPTDIFLAAYPRSGTNWLAFLIANVLNRDSPEPLNLRNFLKYTPDINGNYFHPRPLRDFALLPDPRVFLVHAPYDPSLPNVIYLLRDPRDVMVSYWHYQRLVDPGFQLSIKEFIANPSHWPCPWDEHVSGWLLGPHDNRLVVRYEELYQNTAAVLKRVLDFSGIRYQTEEIARAAEASGFERMQSLEKKFGCEGVRKDGLEYFIRRGRVGGYRDELDSESLRLLEEKCSPLMQEVGYEPVS